MRFCPPVITFRFLRVSGGVSSSILSSSLFRQFSPRKRRCFQSVLYHFRLDGFLRVSGGVSIPDTVKIEQPGFLRVSGGVSNKDSQETDWEAFSPRKRRCFWGYRKSIS